MEIDLTKIENSCGNNLKTKSFSLLETIQILYLKMIQILT